MNTPEYILLLDVETANTIDDPLVYDLGVAVTDRKGRIYEEYSFIIYDVYRGERELMQTCYYAWKIPTYERLISANESKIVQLSTARRVVRQLMKKYNIKNVAAYNAYFDQTALNTTLRYIFKSSQYNRYFFPYGTKFWCVWHMACQVICTQPTYQRWCRAHGFISASGNVQTNAETVYAYITQDPYFQEEHKGLDDVRIEAVIMAHCFRQHKAMKKNIFCGCWRIPNTKSIKEKFAA